MSLKEQAELGALGIDAFFQQFGMDIYTFLLLEVLIEELIKDETLLVFGEQEQTGDQTDNGFPDQQTGSSEINGPRYPDASPDVGT